MSYSGPAPVADPVLRLSAARAAVLAYLVDAGEPVIVQELAANSGAHINTVREHLEALVAAGLVERSLRPSEGRGRPAVLYNAAADASVLRTTRQYAALLDGLAAHLVDRSPDPEGESIEIGRKWAQRVPAYSDPIRMLEGTGFEPEQVDEGRYLLTTCPLVAMARRHPRVVCNVHLGLLRALAGDETQLEPFVGEGCLVTFPEGPRSA